MQIFISSVIKKILDNKKNLINTTIILPSKRSGVFFKNDLKKQLKPNSFLPKIISIEEFITNVSKIKLLPSIEILFEFYQIYLENTLKKNVINFEQFLNWATILLQDINEIDRHLINATEFFNYLSDINRIENWFLKSETNETVLTKKHLNFFNSFAIYYQSFYDYLISKNKGYQGLQYREATKNIDAFIESNANKKFIFIGFNALNKAEELIITKILDEKLGEIYFDIDQFFIHHKLPYANFINTYKNKWNYFNSNTLKTSNNFINNKVIHIIGVPKNVTLLKETGIILKNIHNNHNKLQNTALVLANENLLTTALNSLPKEVSQVNITMGYPLKNIELSNFFLLILKLHQNKIKIGNNKTFYYKDVLSILNQINVVNYFNSYQINIDETIIKLVLNENISFISLDELKKIAFGKKKVIVFIELLFSDWLNVNIVINRCLQLIILLKNITNSKLDIEYLYRFDNLFQQIKNLNLRYNYINDITSLLTIFKQLLQTESLSFKGEPLSGLQIMGMLETRVLDFENIIITSVNEGFIPSGKTNNSFIPFDVKCEFDISTYREKDAIFSYHFFRLLQRAKNIYLLYNTETDDFGSGEQSRFITQLEVLKDKLPNIEIKKSIVSPKLQNTKNKIVTIYKSDDIINKLQELAEKGLSPTTLTKYIYNPIEFYKNKILKIKSLDKVEETITTNIFGTIIHNTLEELYKPYINKFLSIENIKSMQKKVVETILKYFNRDFKNGDLTSGKNVLTFEISKHYITTFLNQEILLLKSEKKLKILALEVDLKTTINVNKKVFKLKGQADRIDELDGVIRIIDYKTGKVDQSNLNIKNWKNITTNYKKYSKSFQVLMYAYIYAKANHLSFENKTIESGIISFKNLKLGFLKVNKKPISNDEINKFEIELISLIKEIYNQEIPFIENENLAF